MRLFALRSELSLLEQVTALEPLNAADRKIIDDIRSKYLKDSKDDRELSRDELINLFKETQTATPALKSLADKVKLAFNNEILSGNAFLMDDLDAFLKFPDWKQKNVIELANYLGVIGLLPNKPLLGPVFEVLKPILFTNPIALKEAIQELFNHRELNHDNPQRTLQLGNLLSKDNMTLIASAPVEHAAIIAKCLCILHKKELLQDNREKLVQTKNLSLVATAISQLKTVLDQSILDRLFTHAADASCTADSFYVLTLRYTRGNNDYKLGGGTAGLFAPFSVEHGFPPTDSAPSAAPMSNAAIATAKLIPEDQTDDFCSKVSALFCRRK